MHRFAFIGSDRKSQKVMKLLSILQAVILISQRMKEESRVPAMRAGHMTWNFHAPGDWLFD